MASKGGVGHRPRRRAHAAARGRHGALRDHGLRVPGADAVRLRARARSTTCSRCARAGRCTARRSARSPTPARCASSAATSWSATCPWRRSSTTARSTSSRPSAPPRRSTTRRAATLATGGSVHEALLGPARLAQPRLAPAAVRAVRLDRAVAHRAPPGGGRRRGARAARRRRARGGHRRQRPPRGRRPLPRHDRGDARVRGEPRLRRRRAARA